MSNGCRSRALFYSINIVIKMTFIKDSYRINVFCKYLSGQWAGMGSKTKSYEGEESFWTCTMRYVNCAHL